MLKPSDHAADLASAPTGFTPDPAARVAEANHRIANNLSLVIGLIRAEAESFAARRAPVEPAGVARMLEEIAARIDTVGHLHRLLSAEAGRASVDVADYMAHVCDTLGALTPSGGMVRLVCDLKPACRLRPDEVLPLALIVSEAVTNAVKYAHPSGVPARIGVVCRREREGSLLVEVRDDGVGLPEGFDTAHDGGLGLQVMRALARQLGSELQLESGSLGLAVRVRMAAVARAA